MRISDENKNKRKKKLPNEFLFGAPEALKTHKISEKDP
jgi:hypothetical protein